MNNETINFRIERDGEEYHAWIPELPGCHTHGKTPKEAMQHLKDAMNLYLETLLEETLEQQILEMKE